MNLSFLYFWDDPQVKDFILDQRMKIAYPMREVNSFTLITKV